MHYICNYCFIIFYLIFTQLLQKRTLIYILSRLPVSATHHLGIVLDKHVGKQQLESVVDCFTKPGLSNYSNPTTPPTYLLWPSDLMRDYITEPVLDCQAVQGVSKTSTAWIQVFSCHISGCLTKFVQHNGVSTGSK